MKIPVFSGCLWLLLISGLLAGCLESSTPPEASGQGSAVGSRMSLDKGRAMSRKAPKEVPPVEHNGIRYEQVMSPALYELDDGARYLRASRISDGETLWIKPVFEIKRDPSKERGVQSVYFEKMLLGEDGKILIRNEHEKCFAVDPETGAVKRFWFCPKELKAAE